MNEMNLRLLSENSMVLYSVAVSVFRGAFAFAAVNNFTEMRAEVLKILAMYRRPVPRVAATIGAWLNIFQSNKVFSLFMDETMTYSCAIFKSEDKDLKAAQMRKTSLLIEKARVDKNHAVLEIGFGWENLAIEIVKQTGCKYTDNTLSKKQLLYAERKVKEAGLHVFSS